jgi:hypothetical protein
MVFFLLLLIFPALRVFFSLLKEQTPSAKVRNDYCWDQTTAATHEATQEVFYFFVSKKLHLHFCSVAFWKISPRAIITHFVGISHSAGFDPRGQFPLLIGSRALRYQLQKKNNENPWIENLSTQPKDWDLVMTLDDAASFVVNHLDGLVDLQFLLEDPNTYKSPEKIICRYKSGTVLEIEIAEYFESWSLVPIPRHEPVINVDEKLDIAIDRVGITPWEVLLAIKYSHLFLPVHWKKSARQVAEILRICPLDRSVANSSKLAHPFQSSEESAKFIKMRQTENYRIFRTLRPNQRDRVMVPKMTRDQFNDVKNALNAVDWKFESSLLKPAAAGEDSFVDCCSGLRFSRKSWSTASLAERTKAIVTLVVFALVNLYIVAPSETVLERLQSNRGTWASSAEFSHAMWDLALESLCTSFLALPQRTMTHLPASFFAATTGVYHCFAADIDPTINDKPIAPKNLEGLVESLSGFWIDETNVKEGAWRKDFALEARAHDSPLMESIFFSLVELLDPKIIPSCVQTLCGPLFDRITKPSSPGTSAIPQDIWNEIFSRLDDHLSIVSLSSVCKSARSYGNSDAVWEPFAKRIFADKCGKPNPKKPEPWKTIFKNCYLVWREHTFSYKLACAHKCGGRHAKMTVAMWESTCDEDHWGRCVCSDCDAGSWSTCEYKDRFLK